jgi:hypothetical protein
MMKRDENEIPQSEKQVPGTSLNEEHPLIYDVLCVSSAKNHTTKVERGRWGKT